MERTLNRLFVQTRNKSNALFSIVAVHLDRLLRTYGERNLVIFCDRQGAREHYGAMLRLMFDEWALEILGESEKHAVNTSSSASWPSRAVDLLRKSRVAVPSGRGGVDAQQIFARSAYAAVQRLVAERLLPDVHPNLPDITPKRPTASSATSTSNAVSLGFGTRN